MAALSAAWLAADAGQALNRGDSLDTLWQGYGSALNWAILLWPAVGPWGIGKGLQVGGATADCLPSHVIASLCIPQHGLDKHKHRLVLMRH